MLAACVPPLLVALVPPPLPPAAALEPRYKIIRGRRVPIGDAPPFNAAFDGECIDTTIEPRSAAAAFTGVAALAFFAFQTETNRAEALALGQPPGAVGRQKWLTFLALETGASLGLGPQLTNPCSNANTRFRAPEETGKVP